MNNGLSQLIFPFVAVIVSMAVISIMWRFAPALGMMDKPDPRKVHAMPVARVGGWGIVVGSVLPLIIWLPIDHLLQAYLFGSFILLLFGSMDDVFEMGHYPKFIGQIAAVSIVIFYGDLYIQRIPFFEEITPAVGIPLTLFAMVGMINAINHSDGLDGLAGGESLLSLIVIAFLAYAVEGSFAFVIAIATIGGILGFLRFNTHPARVFMGDSGSQFLGFTLGFLAVYLTQKVDTTISAALPFLFLGLPIVDILMVLYKRVSQGMNWFKATRNHIHHRLLDLDFYHYETVVIIYAIQAALLVSSLFLRYEWDWLIIGIYLASVILLFAMLEYAERRGWRAHKVGRKTKFSRVVSQVKESWAFKNIPVLVISVCLPLYLSLGSVFVSNVSSDFGYLSLILFLLLMIFLFINKNINSLKTSIIRRGVIYITSIFIVYLSVYFPPDVTFPLEKIEIFILSALFVSISIVLRFSKDFSFQVTPMDYLVVFLGFAVGILAEKYVHSREIHLFFIKSVIVLYSCEVLVIRTNSKWNSLNVSSLLALLILGVRGIVT